MKLSRRRFLAGVSLSVIAQALPRPSEAWIHGVSAFNGGLSQVNFNFLQGGGEFPFINKMKESSNWSWADSTTVDAITPDLLDSDGYPIASAKFTTHGGMGTGFNIPTQSEFAGNYVLSWSGSGTIKVTIATGSGSLTSVSGGGTVTPSGNGFTVTASPWVFTPSSGATSLSLSIISLGSPEVTNVAVYNINEQTAFNSGQIFSTKFLNRLAQAKFGVLRFLNWQASNITNITNWNTANRPLTYFTYNLSQYRSDLLANSAGSGVTTNSGADYTVSAPSTWATSGGLPADKSVVHVVWNASSPTSATVTFSSGSGGVLNVNWTSHGLQTGNQIYFTTTGSLSGTNITASTLNVVPNTYYFATVVDANTLNIAATSGGTLINFGSAGTGTITGRTNVTLNVGSTAAVQVYSEFASQLTSSGNAFPVGGSFNSLSTLTYDALLNAWIKQGGTIAAAGIHNGVPVNIMLALAIKVGAHPWFVSPCYTCTPMSDWHTQLAALLKSSAPSWMIPRIEGPNELWNGAWFQTGYANSISQTYGWGTDPTNWYGKAMSTIGQAVNAAYGGSVDGTKYQIVCSNQASSDQSPAGNNARLQSTKYVLQSPQAGYTATPAYNWVTTVAHAAYINPWQYGYNQEIPLAYNYFVSPTTQAATYAAGLLGGGVATVSGSTVTLNNHGFVANQLVVPFILFGGTLPTPLSSGENLYVLSTGLTTNAFEVATSEGGSAITFSGGSGTLYFSPAPQTAPNIVTQNMLDLNLATWAASIGSGSKVIYSTRYEGGYAPVYSSSSVTSQVTAATNANPMVLTLGTTNNQGIHTAQPSDQNSPAVAGMFLTISGISDPNWTSLNGQQVTVASVSGASITTTFNASAFAAPFAGSGGNGTATYFLSSGSSQPMSGALNALRLNGKYVAQLQTYLTTDYTNLTSISITGSNTTVVGQFPSLFQMGGPINGGTGPTNTGNNVWSVLEDIYESPDPPQWLAIAAFN